MSDITDKSAKKLKRLTIRDVPDHLHYWLKVESAKRRVTIADFLIEICAYWEENHKP